MKELWRAPQQALNGCSELAFAYRGGRAQIILKYGKGGRGGIVFSFEGVLYFRHIGGYFVSPEELTAAYEALNEIEDSEILKELKARSAEEAEFWTCRHYSLYTEDDRLFDVVAKNCKIEAAVQ